VHNHGNVEKDQYFNFYTTGHGSFIEEEYIKLCNFINYPEVECRPVTRKGL